MKRLMIVLVVLALALLPAGTVFAQADSGPQVNCGELDEEDCNLLTESAMAASEVTEGAYDVTLDFSLSGVPDAPFEEVAITWQQSAEYVVHPEQLAQVAAMHGMASADMMGDAAALSELFAALTSSVDTIQEINLTLSEDVAELFSKDMPFAVPAEIRLRYALVDGVGYVNLDDFAAMAPEMGEMSGWIGVELAPVLAALVPKMMDDPDLRNSLAVPAAGMAGGMSMASQPMVSSEFNIVERLDDDEIDGEEVAVFLTTYDFAGFLSSPEFVDVISQQMATSGEMSPADIEEFETMLPFLAPMLAQDMVSESLKYISLDTAYELRSDFQFDWDLSNVARLAQMGEGSKPSPQAEPTLLSVSLGTDTHNQNDIGSIEAPEGAVVLPVEMIVDAIAQSEM